MADPTTGWIVTLEPGCWLAPWRGDPGRTLVRASARVYPTELGARRALHRARKFRPFPRAAVERNEVPRG